MSTFPVSVHGGHGGKQKVVLCKERPLHYTKDTTHRISLLTAQLMPSVLSDSLTLSFLLET